MRDWLHVEDHVDALLLAACRGKLGSSYCVGGYGERTNREIVELICSTMDKIRPQNSPHDRLIKLVKDRPGHDRRYAIDPNRIQNELGWRPRHTLEVGLEKTVEWYLKKQEYHNK